MIIMYYKKRQIAKLHLIENIIILTIAGMVRIDSLYNYLQTAL
jgi:hypothetical protein